MATCTTFVIMTGGVDLSVGPVLAATPENGGARGAQDLIKCLLTRGTI